MRGLGNVGREVCARLACISNFNYISRARMFFFASLLRLMWQVICRHATTPPIQTEVGSETTHFDLTQFIPNPEDIFFQFGLSYTCAKLAGANYNGVRCKYLYIGCSAWLSTTSESVSNSTRWCVALRYIATWRLMFTIICKLFALALRNSHASFQHLTLILIPN